MATLLKKQKPITLSRVAWWPGGPDRAEGVLGPAVDHRIGGRHRCAGRPQRRPPGGRAGGGVGVDGAEFAVQRGLLEKVRQRHHVAFGVRQHEVFPRGQGCVHAGQGHVQPGGEQVVFDRVEPPGAFGVAAAHVVGAAVRVREVGSRHPGVPVSEF
jgi:hypothetical protein